MKITKSITFNNRRGLILRGEVHEAVAARGTVVFLHGFPGTSDYLVSQRMVQFCDDGYNIVRFDFSGSGDSEGNFYDKLISKEVEDADAAIRYAKGRYQQPIHLVGHSTGAIVACLYVKDNPPISTLTLLGGVSRMTECVHYDFTLAQISEFLTAGFLSFVRPGHWTDGKRLARAYYDECVTLDVLGSLGKATVPVLISHGDMDESVPFDTNPFELYDSVKAIKWLVRIRGADHKFTDPEHWTMLSDKMKCFWDNPNVDPDRACAT